MTMREAPPILEPEPEGDLSSAEPSQRRIHGVPRGIVTVSDLSWRLVVIAVAIALLGYVLWHVRLVALALFVALLVSTLLVPPADALRRRGAPPALAALLAVLGWLAIIALAGYLIVPPLVDEFQALVDTIEAGIDELGDLIAGGPFGLSQADVRDVVQQVQERLTNSIDAIVSGVLSGAVLVGELLAGAVIALFLLFFFIKDGRGIYAWIAGLFPGHAQDTAAEVGTASWSVLSTYVRGLVFVATFDALFIGLALAILGVPLVLPLAVLTFLAAFVPFIGALVAGAVAALVALVTNGVGTALLVVGAVTLVQQIEGNLLYPLIVGRSMHLHPVAILLAVTTGGVVAGIIGAVVAVPIMAAIAVAVPIIRRAAEEPPPESAAALSEPRPPG